MPARGRAAAWLADRFGLGPIAEHVLHRRVARAPWYFGDGATLALLLGVLVFTGAAMTLTYSPSPDAAYESIVEITDRQPLGWFVRALHYWSAGLMVVLVFVHMFRQVVLGGYKSPREGTWLVGVALFFLVMVMAFTGYTLRWDQRAIYALKVALHMFGRLPVIGEDAVVFIQGGEEPGAATATRLYSVHVILVPALIVGLVALHLYLVIHHGVTSRGERERPVRTADEQRAVYKEEAESADRGEHFHPETTAKSGGVALTFFLIAVGLAAFAGPAPLMPEADLVQRSRPAEEWWFWWYSGLIALLPARVAPWFVVVFPVALFALLVSLPFLDRGPNRGARRRPIATGVVILCAVAMLGLSDLRRRSPWTGWPSGDLPPLPEGVELPARAERGRVLFAQYGCNSCHAVAGHGPRVGPDLARLPVPFPRTAMREYILRPPEGVPMPAYEGRIGEGDLERILDYVHTAQAFPRR